MTPAKPPRRRPGWIDVVAQVVAASLLIGLLVNLTGWLFIAIPVALFAVLLVCIIR